MRRRLSGWGQPDMNSASLQSLHDREESRILRFFQRRLKNREDAADATQETFLRMLTVPRSTLIENPQAYLFQVARSVARSRLPAPQGKANSLRRKRQVWARRTKRRDRNAPSLHGSRWF